MKKKNKNEWKESTMKNKKEGKFKEKELKKWMKIEYNEE